MSVIEQPNEKQSKKNTKQKLDGFVPFTSKQAVLRRLMPICLGVNAAKAGCVMILQQRRRHKAQDTRKSSGPSKMLSEFDRDLVLKKDT